MPAEALPSSMDSWLSFNANVTATMVNDSVANAVNSTYYDYGLAVKFPLATVLSIVMVMAFFGNLLVVLTIALKPWMRTRTNILLTNLALADIMVAVFDMPVALITIINSDWIFNYGFCLFNGFTVGLGLMLSVHTLMWISIHKYISITRPLSRPLSNGRILCMCLAAWAWAVVFNLGPFIGWTETVYKVGASQCGPKIPREHKEKLHHIVNIIFNFVIPIIVMFFCYYKIFAEVRLHMKRLNEFTDAAVQRSILQQRHISRTLVLVLVCFVICLIPYAFYSSFIVHQRETMDKIYNPLAYLALYINSACNPMIYALRFKSFRYSFKSLIFRKSRYSGCDQLGKAWSQGYSVNRTRSKSIPDAVQNHKVSSRFDPLPVDLTPAKLPSGAKGDLTFRSRVPSLPSLTVCEEQTCPKDFGSKTSISQIITDRISIMQQSCSASEPELLSFNAHQESSFDLLSVDRDAHPRAASEGNVIGFRNEHDLRRKYSRGAQNRMSRPHLLWQASDDSIGEFGQAKGRRRSSCEEATGKALVIPVLINNIRASFNDLFVEQLWNGCDKEKSVSVGLDEVKSVGHEPRAPLNQDK